MHQLGGGAEAELGRLAACLSPSAGRVAWSSMRQSRQPGLLLLLGAVVLTEGELPESDAQGGV